DVPRGDRLAGRAVDFARTVVVARVAARGGVVLVAHREATAVWHGHRIRGDARSEPAGERVYGRRREEVPGRHVRGLVAVRRGGERLAKRRIRREVVVGGLSEADAVAPPVPGREVDVAVRDRGLVMEAHELL